MKYKASHRLKIRFADLCPIKGWCLDVKNSYNLKIEKKPIFKMGKRFEQICHQRRYMYGK